MPAEALAEVPVDPKYMTLWGEAHPQKFGFADDAVWIDDYDAKMGLVEKALWKNNLRKLRNQVETSDESMKLRFTDEREFYSVRWRMTRSPFGVPNHQPEVLPTRGQWRGIFFDNKNRVRLFNTFSYDDRVLRVIWRSNQVENKPFAMFQRVALERLLRHRTSSARFQDNHIVQQWALSSATDAHWDSVFRNEEPGQYWTIKRQWAELSYWFPSTAGAAGATDMDNYFSPACSVCETEFTKYSAYTGLQVFERVGPIVDAGYEAALYADTHSYLGYGQFTTVFQAFDEIRKMLDPEN